MSEELLNIRRYLHSKPELSGQEKETAAYIIDKLKQTEPDELITEIGGYGIIAIYDSGVEGKFIAVRADIDALPIQEANDLEYKSSNDGVFHGCGHDGHSTIAIGLARKAAKHRKELSGKVAIIFQPAEETGTGASKMLEDKKMESLHFDFIAALHNLPGYERNALIVRNGNFASSSIGVKIHLYGATAHAAQPMNGNNPVRGMTALIDALNNLPQMCVPIHRGALVTIIHCRLGEIAFGTTPGYAVVMATLRAHFTEDLELMRDKLIKITEGISAAYQLRHDTEWVEYFPAINNNAECVDTIREAGKRLKININEKDYPLPWTEDFAFFTEQFKGALFGLGAGIDHPQIHSDNYDFPDDLLHTGVSIFWEWILGLGKR